MREQASQDGEPRGGSGEMFDRIADRYDLLNRIISLGVDQRWRRRTVEALALGAAPSVLDLATGTGDLAFRIAARHADARVIGLDPSSRMLAVAAQKARVLGVVARVSFERGEAGALPFAAATFDAVTIAFGIRNVADRPRALGEMARVTKQGGRIAVLELSEPRGLLGPLARFHVHRVVPTLGALLSGQREYGYLARSIARFPPPKEFARTMREAGIDVLEVAPLTFSSCCLFVGTPSGEAAA